MKYQNEALNTEAKNLDAIKLRLAENIYLLDMVKSMAELGDSDVDDIKKFLYYGKECNLVNSHPKLDLDLGSYKNNINDENIRLLHAGLGMLTEACEFLKPVIDNITHADKPLDKVNLAEEIGDNQWYQAIACDVLGTTIELEQDRNIAKLKKRYPNKFEESKAINRDVKSERVILEQGVNTLETEYIEKVYDSTCNGIYIYVKVQTKNKLVEFVIKTLMIDLDEVQTFFNKKESLQSFYTFLTTLIDVSNIEVWEEAEDLKGNITHLFKVEEY